MTKISAVVITFNEERNIARCIESIIHVCDEIIVIDSFSKDKTKQICSDYPVKFIEQEWNGYSKTKNYGNSLAKYEYILSIDADEALSKNLQEEILLLKKKSLNGAYAINRITNYCGQWIRHSGWFPDWKIRLFPKEFSKWNDAIVHEELLYNMNLTEIKCSGLLEHYSYYSYQQHQEKADKYSILTAKKYFERKKRSLTISPILSAFSRFISMFIFKLGFLDGYNGFMIAKISAKSNHLKYKELNRLYREN